MMSESFAIALLMVCGDVYFVEIKLSAHSAESASHELLALIDQDFFWAAMASDD